MANRTNDMPNYRYGFNGKEFDTEMHNNPGSSYDFGARIYDSRIGRWLAVDPKTSKYPGMSPYATFANNPLLFIDLYGEEPKVAIIIGPAKGEAGHHEFDDHYYSLKAKGYVVVYAESGKHALELMNKYSSPESPTEDLVLLSHGSPGGLSNGSGGGIYTNMEINNFSQRSWEDANWEDLTAEFLASKGLVSDSNDPKYDIDKVVKAYEGDDYKKFIDNKWSTVKNVEIDKYKTKKGAITPNDIKKSMDKGDFATKNLTVVVGGCNLASYTTLDEQDIFTTEMATSTKSEVYGAQGYSYPIHNSTKRKSTTWIKTSSNGTRTDLKKNTIDLTNP